MKAVVATNPRLGAPGAHTGNPAYNLASSAHDAGRKPGEVMAAPSSFEQFLELGHL
jgi:hypothetical protein